MKYWSAGLSVGDPISITYEDESLSQILQGLPTSFAVKGTLLVDTTVVLEDLSVGLLPGSGIRIPTGISLVVKNCHFYGCDSLWNTILVESEATFTADSCLFEDATYAITAEDMADLSLTYNHFFRNDVGIRFMTPQKSAESLYGFLPTLHANEFDCEGEVLKPPKEGLKSSCGILLEGNDLIITNPTNTFHYMRNGIRSLNSFLKVNGNRFFYITDTASESGCGIYAAGTIDPGFLYHSQSPSNSDTTFSDCKYGIFGIKQMLGAANLRMLDVDYGIVDAASTNSWLLVYGNKIEANELGIFLWFNDPFLSATVMNNDIRINHGESESAFGAAILVAEHNMPPADSSIIYSNTIQVDSSAFGIYVLSSDSIEVGENIINLNAPMHNLDGISMVNCRNARMYCNQVLGISDTLGNTVYQTPRGLLVQETYNSNFSCNIFDKTRTGMRFNNNCPGSVIRGNKFYDHYWGLYYNPFAITGEQIDMGNKWLGSYDDFAAKFDTLDQNRLNLSRYLAKSTPWYLWPPSIYPNPALYQWFWSSDTSSSPTFSCISPFQFCLYPDTLDMADTLANELDYAITQGLLSGGPYGEEIKWLNSRYLFNKLASDTTIMESDTLMQSFYDTVQEASAGVFQQLERVGKVINVLPVSLKNCLNDRAKQVLSISDSIVIIFSLLQNNPSLQDSMLLTAKLSELWQQFKENNAVLKVAGDSVLNMQRQQALQLSPQYNQISAYQTFEANEKMIRQLVLETDSIGLNETVKANKGTILQVANQCPLSGGSAVYIARSLYLMIRDTLWDDRELCLPEGFEIKRESAIPHKEKSDIEFFVYPNPSSSDLFIEWNQKVDATVSLYLFNSVGQTVYKEGFSLNEKGKLINLADIPQGVYQIRIEVPNHYPFNRKLIFVR